MAAGTAEGGEAAAERSAAPGAEANAGAPRARSAPLWALLSLLALAVVTPFVALGGGALVAWVEDQRAAEMARLSALAEDLARAVDRELRGQIDAAQTLAASRSLQEGDVAAFWAHAEDAASRAGGHYVLIAADHGQLVNTRLPIGSPLPRTANPAAVDEVFAVGAPRVGNLGVGAVAQQLLYAVRVPVAVAGEPTYVLSFVPRGEAMLDVVRDSYRPEGWLAAVIDGNGRVVARSRRHEDFFGREIDPTVWSRVVGDGGLIETVDLEGRPSYTAYRRSGLGDWTVFVWAPQALIQAPAERVERFLFGLAALALAASVLAAALAGRLIREPMLRLVAAARRLGAGEPVAYAPSAMREANVVGEAIAEAERRIAAREAALRRNEAHLETVLKELTHRSKNLLAVIQAMVGKSAQLSPDVARLQAHLQERIVGLARSHDLLVDVGWANVPLDELVRAQLGAFVALDDPRVSIEGPALSVRPQAAQTLGMALHELATNALKHGALSAPGGRVEVRWSLEGAEAGRRLDFLWRERGGPPAPAPARRGFGSLVLERVAPGGLCGQAAIEWGEEGLAWRLDAPLSMIA